MAPHSGRDPRRNRRRPIVSAADKDIAYMNRIAFHSIDASISSPD
jgi:hypothetical protein